MLYSGRINDSIDLTHYMIDEEDLKIMLPGDLITKDPGFMHGHGTYERDGAIYSSLLGTVQKTNKLITVNSLKSRYTAQIGDIVVGRVVDIVNKRWKIDIGTHSYAFLHLNATYFPSQRKKNEDDELNMRNVLAENDLVVAEVHSINNDKSVDLQTRNPKYGRLEPGVLVNVDHKLVRKQKHHMIQIMDLSVILGNNGSIFINNVQRNQALELFTKKQAELQKNGHLSKVIELDLEYLKQLSLLNNILQVLSWQSLEISEELLNQLMNTCCEKRIDPKDILDKEALKDLLVQRTREKIPLRIDAMSRHVSLE